MVERRIYLAVDGWHAEVVKLLLEKDGVEFNLTVERRFHAPHSGGMLKQSSFILLEHERFEVIIAKSHLHVEFSTSVFLIGSRSLFSGSSAQVSKYAVLHEMRILQTWWIASMWQGRTTKMRCSE